MTTPEFDTKVWAFYQRLESDFVNTLNYVALEEDNYATYSIEYERQILSIGSEVDILCKLICHEVTPDKTPRNMPEYYPILLNINGFWNSKVHCFKQDILIAPFDQWTDTKRPEWWDAYNAIKHNRINDDNYKKGNLKNTFDALAGLYVLCRFLYKQIAKEHPYNEPQPTSQLFAMDGWSQCVPLGNGFFKRLENNGSFSLIHE